MKTNALWFSTLIFLLVTIVHIVRYVKMWAITFDGFNVPVEWSLYSAIVFACITIWMFFAARE